MSSTTESLEMYLENILVLQNSVGRVRSIDVVHRTGYSKPSVSRAVKLLGNDGCIEVDADGYIILTDKGRAIAMKIFDRHQIICAFFESIGVSHDTAAEDACRIEHVISEESFGRLREFASKFNEKA